VARLPLGRYSQPVLWNVVDVLAIIAAVGLVVMLGPDVIGLKQWRKRLNRSLKQQDEDLS
jgi:hypothetical protein